MSDSKVNNTLCPIGTGSIIVVVLVYISNTYCKITIEPLIPTITVCKKPNSGALIITYNVLKKLHKKVIPLRKQCSAQILRVTQNPA